MPEADRRQLRTLAAQLARRQQLRALAAQLTRHDVRERRTLEELREELRDALIAGGAEPELLDLYAAVVQQGLGMDISEAADRAAVDAADRAAKG